MSISGNYNTAKTEIDIVKKILDDNNICYEKVEKYDKADDADVIVTLSKGKTFLIEVKEEDFETRFKKYGELGIDYISAFKFKNYRDTYFWKGSPKPPIKLDSFLQSVDMDHSFKWGKIYYSKAALWLFFVDKGNEMQYWFYDGIGMTSDAFKSYLKTKCFFIVNNKPSTQDSFYDKHNSSCFFIKPNDEGIIKYLVDINEYVKKV